MPRNSNDWISSINTYKEQYEGFKKELIPKPQLEMDENFKKTKKAKKIDHPLSNDTDSVWNQFYKDNDLWEEIEKDAKRTRNETFFFIKALKHEDTVKHWDRLQRQADLKKSELTLEDKENYIETHGDILSRILFIYAKLNPGIKYVQGMNEILATLYFVFYDTDCPILIDSFESDLFYWFQSLMGEISDRFCRTLDSEDTGIQGKIDIFAGLLKIHDKEVYDHLKKWHINHQFYALKWIMLLLCQDFNIYDISRIWDTLLSDPDRFEFLNYICLSMIHYLRDIILEGDFSDGMQALQKFPQDVDVRGLLNQANTYVEDIPKYEKYIGDHC